MINETDIDLFKRRYRSIQIFQAKQTSPKKDGFKWKNNVNRQSGIRNNS